MENENINEELLKRALNSTEKSNLEENNSFDKSKYSPIPVPNAVIIVFISSFPKALSNLAFSTFNIFPLNGKIA